MPKAVNLSEEPDAGNPHVRFREGPGPTDTGLNQPVVSGETGLLDSHQGKFLSLLSTLTSGECSLPF